MIDMMLPKWQAVFLSSESQKLQMGGGFWNSVEIAIIKGIYDCWVVPVEMLIEVCIAEEWLNIRHACQSNLLLDHK